MKQPLAQRLTHDRTLRLLLVTLGAMGLNVLYALYNGILGVLYRSPWCFVLCGYYLILGWMRFFALSHGMGRVPRAGKVLLLRAGVCLLALALILSLSVLLGIAFPAGRPYPAPVTLGMAAYALFLFSTAGANVARTRRRQGPILITLRNISCAGAAAAAPSLARSLAAACGGGEPILRGVTAATGSLAVAAVAFWGLSSLRLAWRK